MTMRSQDQMLNKHESNLRRLNIERPDSITIALSKLAALRREKLSHKLKEELEEIQRERFEPGKP